MRAKPLFVLDECVSGKTGFSDKYFVQSVDLVGRGATDDQVFEAAKSLKIPIVTRDKLFVLKMIVENYPVVFKYKNKTIFIKAKVEENPKYGDPVSFYLHKTKSIVYP